MLVGGRLDHVLACLDDPGIHGPFCSRGKISINTDFSKFGTRKLACLVPPSVLHCSCTLRGLVNTGQILAQPVPCTLDTSSRLGHVH